LIDFFSLSILFSPMSVRERLQAFLKHMHRVGAVALAKQLEDAISSFARGAIDRAQYKAIHTDIVQQFEANAWAQKEAPKRKKTTKTTTTPSPPPPPEDFFTVAIRHLVSKSPMPLEPGVERLLLLAMKQRYDTMVANLKRDYRATVNGTQFMAKHGRETSYPRGELEKESVRHHQQQLQQQQQPTASNITATLFAKRRRTASVTAPRPSPSPLPPTPSQPSNVVPLHFAMTWIDPYLNLKLRMIIMNGIGIF
jgi:sRNA-binding protein